jgi:DHA1 family tetracycline resistance protein-like MFS transporter
MMDSHSSTPPVSAPQKGKFALGLIFSIMLMDIVGLLVIAPVAPYIIGRYSPDALMVTMTTVFYAAAQFFAAPLMGKLGDRFGRRPVLLISLLGQAVGYFLFGLGGALWILFLGRITGGNFSTATAYIADVSHPEERAKNFTLIGIAWSLGLVLGPAMGAVFGQISLDAPAFVAAGLSVLNTLLGYFFLPESLSKEGRSQIPLRLRDLNPAASIFDMVRKPGLGWILATMGLFNFAFNGINSTNSMFYIRKFSAEPAQIGSVMTFTGIALGIVQFLLVQRVVKRFGEKRVAVASLTGQAVFDVMLFFAPGIIWVFPINMLVSALSGFTFPTLTTLATNRVLHREVGLLMGVTTAIGSFMNIFGPVWGGLMFDQVMPGAPLWMGAIILGLAALVLAYTAPGAPAKPPTDWISPTEG